MRSSISFRLKLAAYRSAALSSAWSASSAALSDLLQLLQVMDIVTGQLGRDPVVRQRSVLRMRERALALRRREPFEHRDVQTPKRRIRVERGGTVRVSVDRQPRVLIQRLRDVAVLRHGKTHADRQANLHLREMNDDEPRAPF